MQNSKIIILPQPIAITLIIVRDKDIGEESLPGEIVALSTNSDRVRTSPAVEPWSNLLVSFCDRREAGELYAKVLEANSDRLSIRFTAVPPALEEL